MKPCPCCGSDRLQQGALSAQSMGVKCDRCGLTLSRWVPQDYPRRMPDRLVGMEAVAWLEHYTLGLARRAWNRRTPCPEE